MSDNETQTSTSEEEVDQQFLIHKIYIKDVSFESPASPQEFSQQWQPDINIELDTKTTAIEEDTFEVTLSITTTAKSEEKLIFLVEVQQSGLFYIKGFNQQELAHMLGSFCPNILFPYSRETISDLVTRGGFPQLLLAPVNFDALYAQHLENFQSEQEQTDNKIITH